MVFIWLYDILVRGKHFNKHGKYVKNVLCISIIQTKVSTKIVKKRIFGACNGKGHDIHINHGRIEANSPFVEAKGYANVVERKIDYIQFWVFQNHF